jgi:hypothetical protein
MDLRRLIILGLCNTLLTAGASLAGGDESKTATETPAAFRVVYRKDHKQMEWTTGTERFRSAQAAETAAQRLVDARAVVAARVEAFDPATGKAVANPRPQATESGPVRSAKPAASAAGEKRSHPPGERWVPTDGINAPPIPGTVAGIPTSNDTLPFINLGRISVTNDFIPRRRPPKETGWLAAKGESGAKGSSAISPGTGDLGGRSYGTFQISSAPGKGDAESNVEMFVGRYYAKDFGNKEVNSLPFMETWLRLSLDEDPAAFRKNEEEFIRANNVNPMLSQLEKRVGLDLKDRSDALCEVLWAVAVQHGAGRGAQVVERAMNGKDVNDLKDRDIISTIYKERLRKDGDGRLVYFSSGETSDQTRARVERRFAGEQADALAALSSEPTTRQELLRRARQAQTELKNQVLEDLRNKRAADETQDRSPKN